MKGKLLYLVVILSITSCEDFLDENSTGTMNSQSVLSSPESALAFTNSAYANTTVFNRPAYSWGGNTILLLEYMTGKATSENSQSNFKEFEELTVSARSPYIEEWWQDCYAGIVKCNLALQKLPEFSLTVDEEQISKYQGEVLFMRALYYFYLVRIFGDVPKITTPQTELSELQASRSPAKEIYDEIIIPDLLASEKTQLPFKDETGRVSMGAVKTLLADVYLTYAGYPMQGGTEYYTESAKRSLEVINSGEYALFPEYEDLWIPANDNQGEFIFQVQFSLNKRSNETVPLVLPSRSGMSAFQLEYGSLIPTNEFVESYAVGDKRADEKQFFFTTYKGHPSKFSAGAPELQFMDFKAYYVHKFFDKNSIDAAGQSGLNWTIYRYADVLLMYAEAQAIADGAPNQEALDALNAIRTRAGLSSFTDTNMDEFKKAVWDERYFELSYENKTWFDMVRTRFIRDDLSGNYVNFIGYTTNWGKTYGETQLLFPIPLREIQTNPNLNQNSGY
jgi:hypothetical protein